MEDYCRVMDFLIFLSQFDFQAIRSKSQKRQGLGKFKALQLIELPYWFVKVTIPEMIDSGDFEKLLFEVLKKSKNSISFVDVRKYDNYEKCMFLFWILDQIEAIAKMEQSYLIVRKKTKDKRDYSKLNEMGFFNVVDSIAKDYKYTHSEVQELPYSLVFDIQMRNKLISEVYDS